MKEMVKKICFSYIKKVFGKKTPSIYLINQSINQMIGIIFLRNNLAALRKANETSFR